MSVSDDQFKAIVEIVCREGCLDAAHVVHCLLSLRRREKRDLLAAMGQDLREGFREAMVDLERAFVLRMQGGFDAAAGS